MPGNKTQASNMSEVSEQIKNLNDAIDRAEELHADLKARLCDVLRAEPEDAEENNPPPPVMTNLANSIRVGVDRLQRISKKYEDMLSHIEL